MEHEKFLKVMEFCDQSWNCTNFPPELYQICAFFANIKKFSSSSKSHGNFVCKVCGNPKLDTTSNIQLSHACNMVVSTGRRLDIVEV